MIRIAAVIEALGRGGAERLLVDTARLLDRSEFQLCVYTLFSTRRDYEADLRRLGIAEACLALPNHRHVVAGIRRLRSHFRNARPDIVHTHLFFANLVGRLAALTEGCPVISTIHGDDYEPAARLANPRLTRIKQFGLLAADAMTAAVSRPRIVAVSDHVATSLGRRLGFQTSRMEVIPNAVDTAVFGPDPRRREETRQALGVAPNSPLLICVGRFTPEKGQPVLIQAVEKAQQCIPGLHLLLVGDGACRPEVERLVQGLGLADVVSFLGQRWDVPDLLRASDALVMPSFHEGFGLVLVEALASGIPVVASRLGSTCDIVRQGETGLLVEPNDPYALASALCGLLRDPQTCEVMGRRGREDALARFSLALMVGRLESLYRSVHREHQGRTR